jgi:hypothetical protein
MPRSLTNPLTGQICWYFAAAPPAAKPIAALVVASPGGRPVTLTATAMSWANGVVTLSVPAQPDAVGASYPITVAGVTPAGYNGSYTGTFASPTTITYPLATNPGAVTVQGTVAYTSIYSLAGVIPQGFFNLATFDPNTGAITAAASTPFHYGTRPPSGAWCTMMRVNEPPAGTWPSNQEALEFAEHGLTMMQKQQAAQQRTLALQAAAQPTGNGNPGHRAPAPPHRGGPSRTHR